MVSGFPAAYRSSGRQSAPARLLPCRAASAAASCRLSRIGIGGSCDPGGEVAEPGVLVAAGGEQHLAPGPLGQVTQQSPASSSCSAGVQALGVPAGNPATGSTLSHTHSTGSCARTCSTMSRRWPGSVSAAQGMPLASSSAAK